MDSAQHPTALALVRHEAFVLRLARALVSDESAARDVAQETWLSALEKPPAGGATRSWLARVVRNHASNLQRGARRRSEREERAARRESGDEGQSPQERLELQHRVVGAVLALDEPYRGVVVSAFYEELAPSEIARRRRVPAGTVRSQLSRALEQLRLRLDREHEGGRGAWSAALLGFVGRGEGAAASATTAGGAGLSLPVLLGAGALTAVAVGATWWVLRDPEGSARGALAAVDPDASAGSQGAVLEDPAAAARLALDAPEPTVTAEAAVRARPEGLDELNALLARTRQVKAELLDRRLAVPREVERAYAWLDGLEDAGVARVLDSHAFEHDELQSGLDLPWLRGGGVYWSFSERSHDYDRWPQLSQDQGELYAGFYGRYDGVAVDLGPNTFRALALGQRTPPAGLDAATLAAWDLVWGEVDMGEEGREVLSDAVQDLGLDDRAEVRAGHGYLLRAVSPREFDLLAAIEVAETDDEGSTFAWKILKTWPMEVSRPPHRSTIRREDLPHAPPELATLDEAALKARLDAFAGEARAILFDRLPTDLLERHAGLLGRDDAGLTRVLDYSGPFQEFIAEVNSGAWFSFATRGRRQRDEADLYLDSGGYAMSFNVRSLSWFLDLGEVALEDAESAAAAEHPAAWTLLRGAQLEHFESQPRRTESQLRLKDEAEALGLGNRVRGGEGHTYLVRSIFPTWHDHLVAFHVARRDELGDVLAWRILRAWPVQERAR